MTALDVRGADTGGDPLPPQDLAAEQVLLGSMLLSSAAIEDVLQDVTVLDFYRPAHATIFEAVADLHQRGEPADAFTVGHSLTRSGNLVRVGGLGYLHTCIAAVPTAANAGYYAEIITSLATQRRAIEALTRALQRVRAGDPDAVDEVLAETVDELGRASGSADTASTWAPVDLAPVLDGTYQPPQPTVGEREDGAGLFYPGRVHSISAESESGKSWLALLACRIELDRGHSVLYMDFEDDEGGVVGRLLDIGANPDAIRSRFLYVRPMDPVNTGRNRALLADLIDTHRPTLAVLDGVTEAMTLHGLNLVDNTEIARFGTMLPRWVANLGPAVVNLDHVTKDREGRGRYSIGGQHKLAGLNGAAFVMENRTPFGVGVTGRSTVYIAKDRPAQLRQHAAPARDGLHWYADLVVESVLVDGKPFVSVELARPVLNPEDSSATFRPTVLMGKVSAALAAAPRPLSKTEICERVRGKRATDVRAALAALVDEGFVEEQQGARGARNHRLIKPFEEPTA